MENLILFSILIHGIVILLGSQTSHACFCAEKLTEKSFGGPVILERAGDGTGRMFIGELPGLIYVIYPDGRMLPEPFLDVRPRMGHLPEDLPGDDMFNAFGILGMAVHPAFEENGLFYVHFSTEKDGPGNYAYKSRIGEFRVSTANKNIADREYFRSIIDVPHQFKYHDGGQILFGDDGYLYIFTGDDGLIGDPHDNSQNMNVLHGKVLRIDVDNPPSFANYSIPPDNPFIDLLPNGERARPEIYAYGLRNPWRCGKDPGDPVTGHGKGRIICGDAGQRKMEELDLIEKGANYGWNIREGTLRYCFKCPEAIRNYPVTEPIYTFKRTQENRVVIGGVFYHGCHLPNIDGAFIYGTFGDGKIFRLLETGEGKWDSAEIPVCEPQMCQGNLSSVYTNWILSFGVDEYGEVYLLSSHDPGAWTYEGYIYRLVDPSVDSDEIRKCRLTKYGIDKDIQAETDVIQTSTDKNINDVKKQIGDKIEGMKIGGTVSSLKESETGIDAKFDVLKRPEMVLEEKPDNKALKDEVLINVELDNNDGADMSSFDPTQKAMFVSEPDVFKKVESHDTRESEINMITTHPQEINNDGPTNTELQAVSSDNELVKTMKSLFCRYLLENLPDFSDLCN